jgi:hypothetical protein
MAAEFGVDEIRAAYPSPMAAFIGCKRPQQSACYGVGGAFYQFLARRRSPGLKRVPGLYRFPTSGELSKALCEANPRLSEGYADVLAAKIIRANDLGLFDLAWRRLGVAMRARS